MLTKALVAAAIVWPLAAGGAVWHRASHPDDRPALGAAVVYLAGGRICHQRPERSFATRDVQWPVCARCSGLYLAAPFQLFPCGDSTKNQLIRYLIIRAT